jgi:hypothetical protein
MTLRNIACPGPTSLLGFSQPWRWLLGQVPICNLHLADACELLEKSAPFSSCPEWQLALVADREVD